MRSRQVGRPGRGSPERSRRPGGVRFRTSKSEANACLSRMIIAPPKRVVSVSLGSSTRDHHADMELLGERFELRRVGVDGSLARAAALLRELDGTVDAIGLGGIDVFLYAGNDRYALRDGLRLLETVKHTPVVDGSGLKNTLERRSIDILRDD